MNLPQTTFSGVLSEGLRSCVPLLRARAREYAIIVALIALCVALRGYAALACMIATGLLTIALQYIVARSVLSRFSRVPLTFGRFIEAGFIGLIVGVVLSIGYALFVIPGIWLTGKLAPAWALTLIDFGDGVAQTSWRITRGAMAWQTFVVIAIPFAISSAASYFVAISQFVAVSIEAAIAATAIACSVEILALIFFYSVSILWVQHLLSTVRWNPPFEKPYEIHDAGGTPNFAGTLA